MMRMSTAAQTARASESAPLQAATIKRGWLLMRTGFLARWQRRHVAIVRSPHGSIALHVHASVVDDTPLAEIDLGSQSTVVELVPDTARAAKRGAHNFAVAAGQRRFLFAAATRAELDDWFPLLTAATTGSDLRGPFRAGGRSKIAAGASTNPTAPGIVSQPLSRSYVLGSERPSYASGTSRSSSRTSAYAAGPTVADRFAALDADLQHPTLDTELSVASPPPSGLYGRASVSRKSSVSRRPVSTAAASDKPASHSLRNSTASDGTMHGTGMQGASYTVSSTFGGSNVASAHSIPFTATGTGIGKEHTVISGASVAADRLNDSINTLSGSVSTVHRGDTVPRNSVGSKSNPGGDVNMLMRMTPASDETSLRVGSNFSGSLDGLSEQFSGLLETARQMDAKQRAQLGSQTGKGIIRNSQDSMLSSINGLGNAGNRDWNVAYQTILERPAASREEQMQKDLEIMQLVYNFKKAALAHAKAYIDSYHISPAEGDDKWLGFAARDGESDGQLLFFKDGIAFSFACNYALNDEDGVLAALRNSSSELRAVNTVTNIIFKEPPYVGLHTALMALIDYKGFRMVAVAEMQEVNVVYDLLDQPAKENGGAVDRLQQLGLSLSLKPHSIQLQEERRATVYVSASTVVHLDPATDWYYLSNLQQTFPADFADDKDGREEPDMTLRLRPELLLKYKRGVVSDAFSNYSGASDSERDTNDSDAIKAGIYLREVVIPKFALDLDNLVYRPVDSASLTEVAHANGVNVRHLALVAAASTTSYVKQMCFIEVIARACKQLINKKIYSSLIHFREVGATKFDSELCRYVTDMFNKILGKSSTSQKFFETDISPILTNHFQCQLPLEDFVTLHRPALFLAIQHHTNVSYESRCDYDFTSESPISTLHFLGFGVRIKTLGGIEVKPSVRPSQGESIKVDNKKLTQDKSAIARLSTSSSMGSYKKNDSITSNFPQTSGINVTKPAPVPNASVVIKEIEENMDELLAYKISRHFESFGLNFKAMREASPCPELLQASAYYLSIGDTNNGRMYAQASLKSATRNSTYEGLSLALILTAIGLETQTVDWAIYREARQVLEWSLGPSHPAILILHETIIHVLAASAQYETMLEHTRYAAALSERALNRESKLVASYYDLSGRILLSLNRVQEAMAAIVTAGELYPPSTSDEEVALSLYFRTIALASLGETGKALQVSQRACEIREKRFGARNEYTAQSCEQIAKLAIEMSRQDADKAEEYLALALFNLEKVFNYVRVQRGLKARNADSGIPMASRTISATSAAVSRQVSVLAGLGDRAQEEISGGIRASTTSVEGQTNNVLQPFSLPEISGPQTRLPMVINIEAPTVGIATAQIIECKFRQLSLGRPEVAAAIRERLSGESFDTEQIDAMAHDLTLASPAVFFDAAVGRLDFDNSALDELALVVFLGEQVLV